MFDEEVGEEATSSSSGGAGGSSGGVIDPAVLTIPQLRMLKQQMEEEMQAFSQSLQQLQTVMYRFQEAKEALQQTMTSAHKGKPMLVPMTSSVYVAGELDTVDKVLVDIGTGYFVEKTNKDADVYFARKLKFLEEKCGQVNQLIVVRRRNLEVISLVLQRKLLMQQPQQQHTGGMGSPSSVSSADE